MLYFYNFVIDLLFFFGIGYTYKLLQKMDTFDEDYAFFERILPDQKPWYSTKEVAAIIGKSEQYVRDCFENQKILGHTFNGKAKPGKEQRHTHQISRQGLILFLMETANYRASDFIERAHRVRQNFNNTPQKSDQ